MTRALRRSRSTSRPLFGTARRLTAGLVSVLLALGGVVATATPANAAGDYLQIDKSVDKPLPLPGDTFTYSVKITCSEVDCLDTQLTDVFPAGLEGFEIQDVRFTPETTPIVVTWAPTGGDTPPTTVSAGTGVTVDVNEATDNPVGTGLSAGSTFTMLVSLSVPADYPAGESGDIVNTATVTASNANTVDSPATININVPVDIGVDVTKTWSPDRQTFAPGAASAISLGVGNDSNVNVDRLVIQEPKSATDGASALDASNPFTITDFTGFGNVSIPASCTSVQVDAYVFEGGSWAWKTGPPATALELPEGVAESAVGGIRVTCVGDIPPGDTVSFDLGLVQRATQRDTGADLSTATHTVANVATGSATAGDASESEDATASYTVAPAIPTVETSKDIDPDTITAGQSAAAHLSATNGAIPVSELRIADLGFFTDEVTFGGFTAAPVWPEGASAATVVYHLAGSGIQAVAFGNGTTPAAPSNPITGFEIVYTGSLIQADTTTDVQFAIGTTEDATEGDASVTLTNTVTSKVTAPNGLTDTATASDTLRIIDPTVSITLDKKIRPGAPVAPGDSVVASLETNAQVTGDGALLHDIVVEDAWDDSEDGFWNAFSLDAIAPTQVPAGASLTIEVRNADGVWITLASAPAQDQAFVYQLNAAQTDAALAALTLTADDVEGIRFSFHSDAGFPSDITVRPNIVFEAQDELRTGGETTPAPDSPTTYTNTATAAAAGESAGGKQLKDSDEGTAPGTIETETDGPGRGGVDIRKTWTEEFLDAQSGQQADTNLQWRVASGYGSVTITDAAADPADPAKTVFDAFDLKAVKPIAASTEPYSNGWYLRYDTVTAVELYYDGDWHPVAAPGGSWMTETRGFAGYVLTDDESARATAVRLVLEETAADTAAREAAAQVGAAFDPFAPAPGTGVGSGSTQRLFALTWQLRDVTRSDATPVTADSVLNTTDEGVVDNSVGISGQPLAGGAPVTDRDDDTIKILNQTSAVEVTKSATPATQIFTPPVGTPATEYPTATWSIAGHNASTAKASAVRLTDPATCGQTSLADCKLADAYADPFDTTGDTDYLTSSDAPNPFDRFTATKITIGVGIPAEVDLAESTAWLLHYDVGTEEYSTTKHTAVDVNGFTAAELADVIGVSVTYGGVSDVGTGLITQGNILTITIDSQLRPTFRHDGTDQVLRAGQTVDVSNRVFAQSYDPVLSPETQNGDVADAAVELTGGDVNITPTKSISPTLLAEPAKDSPVTVTLGANQGSNPRSTLSPNKVVIEDQADSADFWNTFDFVSLGAVTLPAGADRVQVDLYDGTTWHLGTAGATAVLPDLPAAQVEGIRFTFTRADGGLFSSTLPAANWTASAVFTVHVRDTYRDSEDEVVFDHAVTNTQTSQSTRTDGNDSAKKDADARITLSPGTHEIAVNKLSNNGNRLVSVGVAVPFDLTFQNTGTGYLTISELTDALPAELQYLDTPAPVFTKAADGLLSDDVSVALNETGSAITFTWPEGGNRMKPGEIFKIRVYLELQPGLSQGERATNTMTVGTEESLTSCRNTVQGGSTTSDWQNDPTTCGTTDYVGVVSGSNLYTVKGVAGSLPGAYRPGSPDAVCLQNLVVGGTAYFRSPCVANSEADGEDDWVLHNVNAGTVPVAEMTIFDQLPNPQDTLLISGTSRGSQLRPELVADSLKVVAPAGTTQTVEVTTSANVCVGTWTGLTTSPVCEQSGEVWEVVDADTDWSAVTGIRVHLDFRTTTAGALTPGQAADVTFSTVNRLESADAPEGASSTVPADDQLVWNQYGVKYQLSTESFFRKIAPSAVASHLRFGSIQVEKVVSGPAAGYAPASFLADVTCTAGDIPLDLGAQAVLTLDEDNGYSARVDGIPLSAEGTTCAVSEQGELGEFGETSREGSPTTLEVSQPAPQENPAADVPTAQIATLTNDYRFTGLSITKEVDTEATEGTFGPFTFSLSCTSATGVPVTFDDEGETELEFTLEAGETWTAPSDRIPVGAECALAETDGFFADQIVVTGGNVVDGGDGTATITPGIDPAAVVVTNGYDAGTLTVGKIVTGEGADLYGTGSFQFSATCTYHGQTLLDEEFSLRGGDTETFGVYPAGTDCTVTEETTGGATSSALDPEDGTVTIASPAEPGGISEVTVTATNVFDLASFDVVKEREGNLLNPGAAGPFPIVAECTYVVDGTVTALEVPGGAERELSADNAFRTTFSDLPVGATCEVTETDTGYADSTTVTVQTGEDATTTEGTSGTIELAGGEDVALVTITNTFTAGEIAVTKTVSGTDAAAHRGDVFAVTLACTWHDRDLDIPGGAERELRVETPVIYADLPTDAECTLTETQTGDATQVSVTVDGVAASHPAIVTIGKDTTIDIAVDNRFDKPLPATGGVFERTLPILGLVLLGAGASLLIIRPRRRKE